MTHYEPQFYDRLAKQATTSSEVVVPTVYEKLKPRSVLDVGCGVGSWLKEWSKHSETIFGVDGKWVNEANLEIPAESFKKIDLEEGFDLNKKFDLVTCLEVAEHVTPASKDALVDSLIKHGDIILFSAAIPEQGGDNHYNEQWPSYWKKAFEERGYVYLDPFRHLFWDNSKVRYYYRQNIILFAQKKKVQADSFLHQEAELAGRSLVDVIHPQTIDYEIRSVRKTWPIFKQTLINALRNKLGRN